MKTLIKKLLLSFMKSKFYKWLILKIIPFIRLPYYPSLRGEKYHSGYLLLSPGDILLSIDKKKLTTLLVPGEFTHASFCVGKGNKMFPGYEVIEADHKGVIKSYFFDICKEADRVVILRCDDWDETYKKELIHNAIALVGLPYDTEFDITSKNPYCAEIIYHIDYKKTLKLKLEYIKSIDRFYISPDSLYRTENLRIVWDSDGNQITRD